MKGLIVLACTLAVAASSPTLGLLAKHGKGEHCGGSLPGVGGHHLGGIGAGIPGSAGIIGTAVNLEKAKLGVIKKFAGKVVPGGAHFGGVGLADKGYKGRGGVYPVYGGGLGQAWFFFTRGITDVAGNAGSILLDLLSFKIPGAFDDKINALISVSRALGGIIDAFLPGLGTLFGNLVVSIGKIFICVLGSPGLSGAILGDRRPGRDNPVDIPYICRKDWGKKYGWHYDGDYKNHLIKKHYKVEKARDQVNVLVINYTKGRGRNHLNWQQRKVVEHILIIADILERNPSTWTPKDIDTLQVNVIFVVGIIGNSFKSGLGPILIKEWIRTWKHSKGPKRGATDLSRYKDEIFRGIQDAKEDKWSGAFDLNKRGDWDQVLKSSQEEDSADTSDSSSDDQQSTSSGEQSQSSDADTNSNSSVDSSASNNQSSQESSDSESSGRKLNSSNNNQIRESNSSDENEASSNNNSQSSQSTSSDERAASSNNNSQSSQSTSSDERAASSNTNSQSSKSTSSDERGASSNTNSQSSKSTSSDERGASSSASNSNNKQSSNSNSSTGGSESSESDSENSGDGSYNRRDKSHFSDKATEEKKRSSSSSGSGRKEVKSDGSRVEEYNFQNTNSESSKKSSETTDLREHRLETKSDDF